MIKIDPIQGIKFSSFWLLTAGVAVATTAATEAILYSIFTVGLTIVGGVVGGISAAAGVGGFDVGDGVLVEEVVDFFAEGLLVEEGVGLGVGVWVGVGVGDKVGLGEELGLGDGVAAIKTKDQASLHSLQLPLLSFALTLQYQVPSVKTGV